MDEDLRRFGVPYNRFFNRVDHLLCEEAVERRARADALKYPLINVFRLKRYAEQYGDFGDWDIMPLQMILRVVLGLLPAVAHAALWPTASIEKFLALIVFYLLASYPLLMYMRYSWQWFKHRTKRKEERNAITSAPFAPALARRIEQHIRNHQEALIGVNAEDTTSVVGKLFVHLQYAGLRSKEDAPELAVEGYRDCADPSSSKASPDLQTIADILLYMKDPRYTVEALKQYRIFWEQAYEPLIARGKRLAEQYEPIDLLAERAHSKEERDLLKELHSQYRNTGNDELKEIEGKLATLEQEVDGVQKTVLAVINRTIAQSNSVHTRVAPQHTPSSQPTHTNPEEFDELVAKGPLVARNP